MSEQGTVDAQNDLKNIQLRYELDTSDPYNCESVSYSGSEPRFGSIDANGFSAANGNSTFSTTSGISITSTQSLCLYPLLDVQNSATFGETIELQITDPSTDVTVNNGPIVDPNTPIRLASTTILRSPILTQTHYHWRNDDGSEADPGGATSATGGTDDTSYDAFPKATTKRLRMQVSNEGNADSDATQFRLEYAVKSSSCDVATGWTQVNGSGDWDMSDTTAIILAPDDTTNIAQGIGGVADDGTATTFVGTNGFEDTTSQLSSITLTSDEYYEMEFSIAVDSGVSEGTTYCFRVTDAGTELPTYSVYPEATIAADVTVSGDGSQVSTVSIPTNAQLIGGFVFTDATAGGHDIDQITLTASTTANPVTAFDTIELYYETDITDPYDCGGESYGGVLETQYGTTDTDGFSVNGTSTFVADILATPTVNPTQAVCLYVVMDVTSNANDGEKIDIQIADPPNDIVLDTGSIAPAATVDVTGSTLLTAPNTTQERYHWRNDDGTEAGATSATAGVPETPLTEMIKETPYRIRFGIINSGGEAESASGYRLEWAQESGSCAVSTGWTDIDTTNDEFEMVASQLVDNASTTDIATSTGGFDNNGATFFVNNSGQKETSSQTNSMSIPSNNILELEYAIQATATSSEGATYCFRVTKAGSTLVDYNVYPEASIKLATDFIVTRNVATIPNGLTSITLTEGVDYNLQKNDATRAFMRITNIAYTGAGPAVLGSNQLSQNITAYISNPSNITTSQTFTRTGTAGDTRIAWEVVEYVGASGGENEIVVRSQGTISYGANNTGATTTAISGILDDADVVPWITGQNNPDNGRFNYNAGLSTSKWNAASDTATFDRGEAPTLAVDLSYAIIEFVGVNWSIQRTEHTYATAGALESESISAVNSLARTFMHVQKRVGAAEDRHNEFGHEVYLSGIGTVRFRVDGLARLAAPHTSVAWIIENTQSSGRTMKVWRSNGTIGTSGTSPHIVNPDIGTTLDDLTIASIFTNSRVTGTGRSYHEPMMSVQLLNSSTTQYELWVGDPSETVTYRTEVVEWPSAESKLVQNFFQLYSATTTLTPDDPWPPGPGGLAENDEMTGFDSPMAAGDTIRIRMSINVTSATLPAGSESFNLEYAPRVGVGSCDAISASEWVELGDVGSTTAAWRGTSTSPTDGTTLPSTLLSVSDQPGSFENQNPTAFVPNTTVVGDDIEYDWFVEHNNATQKTDYCFRMTYANGDLFESYTYPVVRTVGYGPVQSEWQWFDDETNLTPLTPLAATNTAPANIANDNIIKLRTVVEERSGAAGVDTKFKLQYSEYADFSAGVFDVVSTSTCTQNSIWCYADGAGVDNEIIDGTTNVTADACTAGVGNGCGTHNEGTATTTATLDQPALSNMEFEFTIQNAGARASAVYYFRLYDMQNNEIVSASSSNPSLVVEGPQLTFALQGVASSTVSEGVTSDVDTTATNIPFGNVPIGTEYEAIYRLNVDTSATQGYQVLMYARQPLINQYGTEIPFVSGTNASPTTWAAGCPPEAVGCFGYHAGDDSLANNSARFASNNTYAALSTTTPEEVMYSAFPTNESSDIVYKLQISDQQGAGDYQTQIVYIVVPVH